MTTPPAASPCPGGRAARIVGVGSVTAVTGACVLMLLCAPLSPAARDVLGLVAQVQANGLRADIRDRRIVA